MSEQKKLSSLAVTSFVSGLLFFIPLASLVAIITGIIALIKISANEQMLKGKVFAVFGLILGLILSPIACAMHMGFLGPMINRNSSNYVQRNQQDAQLVLKEISELLEAYAKGHDFKYPTSKIKIMKTEEYCEQIIKSFYYDCEFSENNYRIAARPVGGMRELKANTEFVVTTGGMFLSREIE